MSRIGIDVGGTNTDAALVERTRVLATVKTPTTEDVLAGVETALTDLMKAAPEALSSDAVVVGTTQFTNAVVQRRGLQKIAVLRIGLPTGASLPPFVDWPADLAEAVRGQVHMVRGGHECDGRPIVPMDLGAVRDAARRIADAGVASVAVSAVFSPLVPDCELEAERILREEVPGVQVTLSHELGRIGLLGRENAAALNASLQELAARTIAALEGALRQTGLHAPLYLTRNDGTIARAELARRLPVHCFASGPTNSMRGAAFLSGAQDAIVVDVGGTTSDIGQLRGGFPREANAAVEIGGVRTLFRMPDLLSLGLGGGSEVAPDGSAVGPRSVGYRLTQEARCFGGPTLTATDIAVAAGRAAFGDRTRAIGLPEAQVERALARIDAMITEGVDRMKTEAGDVLLLAVGGGSFLVPDHLPGTSEVRRVEHHAVANAVGAAIAQVGGEVDRVVCGLTRDAAVEAVRREAEARAVDAGAAAAGVRVVEVEDIPLSYLPGDKRRVRVRVIGDAAAVA